jgi:hypothetical protein
MAGKIIHDYLSPPSYDWFYELFHALTEVIASKCSAIHGYSTMIRYLYSQDAEIFAKEDAAPDLVAFTVFAKEFGSTMHRFAWPGTSEDLERNRMFSMDRWRPYDETAWDNMVAQMIAILQPFVVTARGHYEKLMAYRQGQSPQADSVKKMLMTIGQYLDDLSHLCHPTEIESVFRFPPK